jgi:hypothetical protein
MTHVPSVGMGSSVFLWGDLLGFEKSKKAEAKVNGTTMDQ